MENEKPVIIQVHPLLVEELKILKQQIEEKTGYKIYGGMPYASKAIAMWIRENRLKHKKNVEIEYSKIKGEKKIKLLI